MVFEDGRQQRDFVHVRDVAQACLLALQSERGVGQAFNIGSGESRTILSIAHDLAQVMGRPEIMPELVGKYRAGDIRHCFADISLAQGVLGYRPQVAFHAGLAELAGWLRGQVAQDHVAQMRQELEARGLTV